VNAAAPWRVSWRLAATLALIAIALLVTPPIPQAPGYHDFADTRACFGLPNCLDTASNAAFVLAGLLGLCFLATPAGRQAFADARERLPWCVFFAAVVAIGLLSAHYHLAPDHAGLAGDRAAMALAFMAWLAAVIGERVDAGLGLRLLPLLAAVGLASVAWWYWSETQQRGDLRPYLLVQALPIVTVPLLLWRWPPRYSGGGHLLAVIGLYLLALLLDFGDRRVFSASGGHVSGHTLKHLVAACAAAWLVHYLRVRRRV
jgi:hypothetical protein